MPSTNSSQTMRCHKAMNASKPWQYFFVTFQRSIHSFLNSNEFNFCLEFALTLKDFKDIHVVLLILNFQQTLQNSI